jgi:hypothetical protein
MSCESFLLLMLSTAAATAQFAGAALTSCSTTVAYMQYMCQCVIETTLRTIMHNQEQQHSKRCSIIDAACFSDSCTYGLAITEMAWHCAQPSSV